MPPALRATSAALLVLDAADAVPDAVVVALPEPVVLLGAMVVWGLVESVAPEAVVLAAVVVVTNWVAYEQKICCWPW